jgi:phage-related protein
MANIIQILISAKDEASAKIKSIGDSSKDSFKKMEDSSNAAAGAIALIGAAAVGFGALAVKAYDEGQAAIAQTNAVLQSTGGVAGVTGKQVEDLADHFRNLTKYDDETVRGAENMLLTFTNIHSNVFPATTQAVLDMSTAMGTDLKSTSIQVGKALQDPVLGATALQRVGVRMTESQKETIKTMVSLGDTAGAQKIILKELSTEFGGSAEAAGKTFGGQLIITKNQLDEVQKSIGGVIQNAITPLLTSFNDWFQKAGGVNGIMKTLGETWKRVQPYLPVIAITIFSMLIPAFVGLAVSTWAAIAPLIPFIAVGVAVGLMLKGLADKMGGWNNLMAAAQPILSSIASFIGTVFTQAFTILLQVWNFLAPSLMQLWNGVQQLFGALMNLWNVLAPVLLPVLQAIGIIIGVTIVAAIYILIAVFNVVAAVITTVINIIVGIITFLYNAISGYIGLIVGVFSYMGAVIGGIVTAVDRATGGAFTNAWNTVKSVWNGAIGFFKGIFDTVTSAVGSLGKAIGSAVGGAFNGITGAIKGAINGMIDLVNGAIGAINDTAGKLPGVPKIGKIAHLYTGTDNWGGGLAVVGDVQGKGGELINLPKGSQVFNNAQSKQIMQNMSNSSNISINLNYNGRGQFSQGDAVDMAKQIRDALRAQGLDMTQLGALRG